MSIDRAKALKAAQKYLAKGQIDRAISEYERVVEEDPKDARSLLKLGDLYTRSGKNRDAATSYRKVADQYAEQGFFLKAVAVYKQILKLDKSDLSVWEKLASMYELLGLTSDALSTYDRVADAYARSGKTAQALSSLGKVAELDPENVAAWIRYAEALSKADRIAEASQAFGNGADLLKAQGRMDDYLKVSERLLFHNNEDVARALEVAEMYIERGNAKAALAHLQTSFKRNPKDPSTLALLAASFYLLDQTKKAASVYKELAHVHEEAGKHTEEADVLQKLLEIAPSDAEAAARLQTLRGATQETEEIPLEDDTEAMDDLIIVDEEPASGPMPRASSAPPPGDDARIERLMSEYEVFARYKLTDKVIGVLDEVLGIDPNHITARERLKDAYLHNGQQREAATQLLVLSDVVSDRDRALAYANEAATLDPASPGVVARLRELERDQQSSRETLEVDDAREEDDLIILDDDDEQPATPAVLPPTTTSPPAPGTDTFEAFAIAGEDDGSDVDEMLVFDDVEDAEEDDDEPELVLEDSNETMESLELEITTGVGDSASPLGASPLGESLMPAPPHQPISLPPPLPSGASPAGGEALGAISSQAPRSPSQSPTIAPGAGGARLPFPNQRAQPSPGDKSDAQLLDDEIVTAEADLSEAWSAQASHPPETANGADDDDDDGDDELPEEVSDALEEADFYLAQELSDEAIEIVQDALESFPEHPALLAKLTELSGDSAAQDPAPTGDTLIGHPSVAPVATGDAPQDQSFALAQKLADQASSSSQGGPVDVEEVLQQFKHGVKNHVDPGDSATHYDLGIAYMEMGLHGEAIEEFRLCLGDEDRQCTAHTMIGLSFVSKGEMHNGIEHFNQALACPNVTEAEELDLWFEIANAHELLEEWDDALSWYSKVQERSSEFRDVGSRIERVLSAKSQGDVDEVDEFDAMFDNMILKD